MQTPDMPRYCLFHAAPFDRSCRVQMRQHVCHGLYLITRNHWQPWYPSTHAFLVACQELKDPLHIRLVRFVPVITGLTLRILGILGI